MRSEQTCNVGDVFTQNLLAIDAETGKRAVAAELCHHLHRRCVVFVRVFRSPPYAKTALIVVNIAEFVEAVADLVGHSGTSGAVIGRGVALIIKIGWLQEGRGEGFRIGGEYDDRADDLRIDAPLAGIGWPLQLGQIVRTTKGFCALQSLPFRGRVAPALWTRWRLRP
jgi:hypothetical protein